MKTKQKIAITVTRLAPLFGILWSVFIFIQLSRYRSNVPFSDQWNFLFLPKPFTEMSWRELFFRLHGPHYQGISFIIDQIFYQLNDWNVARASRFIALELVMIGWIAVLVDTINTKENRWLAWLSMPIMTCLAYYETVVITPNASHTIFGTLLFMLLCLNIDCWKSLGRHVLFLGTSFLLIFSGFGLQWLFIYPFYLFCVAARQFFGTKVLMYNERLYWILSVLAWVTSAYIFFDDYHPDTAAGEIPPLLDRLPTLFHYSCLMFAGFVQIVTVKSMWVGLMLMLGCLLCTMICTISWIKGNNRRTLIMAVMSAWSLSFSLTCALGRAHLGLEFAQSSRYIIFFGPAFLTFLWISRQILPTALHVLVAFVFLVNSASLTTAHKGTLVGFKAAKDQFITLVLSGKTVDEAARLSRYPSLGMDEKKMDYLRSNKLSFFAQ